MSEVCSSSSSTLDHTSTQASRLQTASIIEEESEFGREVGDHTEKSFRIHTQFFILNFPPCPIFSPLLDMGYSSGNVYPQNSFRFSELGRRHG